MTQRQQFVLHVPGTTDELVNALNMILAQLTDRLDQIEGRRAAAEFFSNVDMNNHQITDLADGVADSDAVNVGQVTDAVDESGLDHTLLDNLNSTDYYHLTEDEYADFTDGGETILHTHDHTLLNNLNSTSYYHLTQANHTDLTDGGATTLHKHDHGGQDGLGDDDHTQYVLRTQWLQNGFVDKSEVAFSWSDANRQLTVSPTGASFRYFCDGILYTQTVAQVSSAIADTEGMRIFYFDGATLTFTSFPTHDEMDAIIEDSCIVAYVYWDATNNDGRMFSELHGYRMSPATHHYLHDNIGAVYSDGMAITNLDTDESGDLDAHAQFGVFAGSFYDEDLDVELDTVASTVGLEIWYLSGTAWRWTTNAGFSVITEPVTGRLAFNDAGAQTAVTSGNFVLCHVFATNCTDDYGANFKFVAIQGQAQYNTVGLARTGADTEINDLSTGDLPMPEIVPVATVIFQTQDSYANAVKARTRTTASGDNWVDWRFSNIVATGTASDHGTLAGLADDDHPGHPWLNGRAGGQIQYGGTAAGEDYTIRSTIHATKGNIYFGTYSTYDEVNRRLGINQSTPEERLHIVSSAAAARARVDTYIDALTSSSNFAGYRARGVSGGLTKVTAGAELTKVTGSGYYELASPGWAENKAAMILYAAEEFTDSANGTSIGFEVTPLTTTTRELAWWMTPGRNLLSGGITADPTSLTRGIVIKGSTAPSALAADEVALYTKDANAVGGKSWWHAMGEDDVEHQIAGIIYKDTTGKPATKHNGSIAVNTYDDRIDLYMDSTLEWREFLRVENADFRTYKAIAMCCDNGTVFPTSPAPATGQWYYRTDLDRLFFYEGGWKPIITLGSADAFYYAQYGSTGDGYSSGAGAVGTIQGAVNLVPSQNYGNVYIYVAAGTYDEQVTIQGKMFPNGHSLYIIGTHSATRTGTCTSTGVKGTHATQGQYNDTNDCGSDAGFLVHHANWGYRIVDTVEAGGSPDYGLICGVFDNQPQNTEQFTIRQWDTIVSGDTAFTVSGMLATVYFYYLDMTGVYAATKSNVQVWRSRLDFVTANTGSSIVLTDSIVSGASWNIVTVGPLSYMQFVRCKIFNNSSGSYTMRMYYNATGDITSGTVFDNNSVGNICINVEMGTKLSCWTDSENAGRNRIRNTSIGINCSDGGGAVNTGSGAYIEYSGVTGFNTQVDDNSFVT